MRLIVEYTVPDCCGNSFTIHDPAVYQSKEAFLKDFEARLSSQEVGSFSIGENYFNICNFKHNKKIALPTVYTVDEWFGQLGV